MVNYKKVLDYVIVNLHRIEEIEPSLAGLELYPELDEVVKENGCVFHGIAFIEKPETPCSCIYIEDAMEFCKEEGIPVSEETVALVIISMFVAAKMENPAPPIADFSLEYEDIKDKVRLMVLDIMENPDVSEEYPCLSMDNGFVLIPMLVFDDGNGGMYRTKVQRSMCTEFSYNEEELLSIGMANTIREELPVLYSLSDVQAIFDLSDGDISSLNPLDPGFKFPACEVASDRPRAYVLSNHSERNGATVMFYPQVMETLADKIGSFYVIPANLDQVIIIPEADATPEYCFGMLQFGSQGLEQKDILSRDLFLYNKETEAIERMPASVYGGGVEM